MEFELKNVDPIGGVKVKNETTTSQLLSITVGVVGCPYNDIKTNVLVEYEFLNSITIEQARIGMNTFALNWVSTNYPNI